MSLSTIAMGQRRHDIDWLRVIAMLAVFVFHCTRFFDTEDWHLKASASEQSALLAAGRGFLLWVWLMELFFLVSGFATWHSLRRHSSGRVLLERGKRLLIPLYTVGLLVLLVPQDYFDRVTHGGNPGAFWQWVPTYYRGLPGALLSSVHPLDPVSWVPFGFAGHLWFIRMLFVIALLTMPVLLFLNSNTGSRFVDRLARWADHRAGIFLFVIPLAVVRVSFFSRPVCSACPWGDFLWYALYYVIGFVLASDERFGDAIKRQGWNCVALWTLGFFGVGGMLNALGYSPSLKGGDFSVFFVVWQTTWSLVSWSAVVFLLSLGARQLRFTNSLLVYSNEAVLPFYLLHQTAILAVGWLVLPWSIGSLAKFLIIATISFSLVLILYEACIRHIGFMRYLFGMTAKKRNDGVIEQIGEADGAANGSQPIRAETNRTSPAAGSHR